MTTDNYKIRILDLAQRWRMGLLTIDEKLELAAWHRSLEDSDLGDPEEMSVEKLEMRLHQLFAYRLRRIQLQSVMWSK